MKKRLNLMFFSICFLAAIVTEAYFIQRVEEDLISVAGIGVVVLITGYLWMDSLRGLFMQKYTEIINLHKAVYTATKKDTAEVTNQLTELLARMEIMENNTASALQLITEYQKKALEGQRNALNYKINYNKENTKQIISAVQEGSNRAELLELLSKLYHRLDGNEREKINPEDKLFQEEDLTSESVTSANPGVIPLYDDPNKNLTTDEIASLFASVRQ